MRDAQLGGDEDDDGVPAEGSVRDAPFAGRDGGRGDLFEDHEWDEWEGCFAGRGAVVGYDAFQGLAALVADADEECGGRDAQDVDGEVG